MDSRWDITSTLHTLAPGILGRKNVLTSWIPILKPSSTNIGVLFEDIESEISKNGLHFVGHE